MPKIIPKSIRTLLRKIGRPIGITGFWDQMRAGNSPGKQSAEWYDKMYDIGDSYQVPYSESPYYSLWKKILERIQSESNQRILEVGCGSGQFASMLHDNGITDYLGFDFSEKAVALAKSAAPKMKFQVDDALTTDLFDTYEHDIIVCTEVLEHLEEDLALVQRFPPKTLCLCTVPNFRYYSHVRHFENDKEVGNRYENFFDQITVSTVQGVRDKNEKFFLISGVRI